MESSYPFTEAAEEEFERVTISGKEPVSQGWEMALSIALSGVGVRKISSKVASASRTNPAVDPSTIIIGALPTEVTKIWNICWEILL